MSKYQQMDQTHWVCYEFPDKSYYYGEVGYLDEAGVAHSKDNQEAANNPANKLVKHGFGIYLYATHPDAPLAKYQGFWDRDRKQGLGKLTIPGQFVYEGGFKEGAYHQHGRMQWSNGDIYQGTWRKSRMQGGGTFRHHDGFDLKGSFKANYFIDENVLRNPQMSEKEYVMFRKERKEVAKQKERNEKIKSGFIMKIKAIQLSKLGEVVLKSNQNNRVPLIVASEQSQFNLNTLQSALGTDRQCHSFDLRKAYLLKGEQKYNYKQEFAEMTRNTLREGGVLIINLDESENVYNHAFYPDLKQFYDVSGFSNNTWNRDTMRREEVHSKVTGGKISENYCICVWSKVKLGQELKEEQIREKLQMRFESILPFIKMDMLFMIQ